MRWKVHFRSFINLLDYQVLDAISRREEQMAEQDVCDMTLEETKIVNNNLKNWNVPGTDGVPAKLP